MMMKSFASVALLFMTVATVTVFASDATTSTPIVVALRQQNVDVLRERLEQVCAVWPLLCLAQTLPLTLCTTNEKHNRTATLTRLSTAST